jgi:hypothetical protein
MQKLGDIEALKNIDQDSLPKAQPEEKRDPAAVATRRLLELAASTAAACRRKSASTSRS